MYSGEVFISLISCVFLSGPRVDCNLGHWVLRRLPPSLSPTWLKDQEGNLKLSGVGEFWLWEAALSSVFTVGHQVTTSRASFWIDFGMTSVR
jgi:hypothetical protein